MTILIISFIFFLKLNFNVTHEMNEMKICDMQNVTRGQHNTNLIIIDTPEETPLIISLECLICLYSASDLHTAMDQYN